MTTQGGVKLGTAGKYCPEDINVIPQLKSLTVTPAKNAQNIAAPDGKVGYSAVTVEKIPDDYIIPSGTLQITSNGTYDVSGKANAMVNVEQALQAKSVTPSKTQQIITADSPNYGLSQVTVYAAPTETATVTPTKSTQTKTPSSGNVGFSQVTVNPIPDDYIIPSGSQNITANGTYDVTNKASVVVNIATAKPTLNAPSISLSGSTLTITNPSSNGSFVTSYTLYNGSTVITTTTSKTINLSTYITTAGTYTLTVKAKGTNFNTSPESNAVTYTLKSQTTPVISLVSGTTIQIDTIDDNATTIEVFADGTSIGSVSKS